MTDRSGSRPPRRAVLAGGAAALLTGCASGPPGRVEGESSSSFSPAPSGAVGLPVSVEDGLPPARREEVGRLARTGAAQVASLWGPSVWTGHRLVVEVAGDGTLPAQVSARALPGGRVVLSPRLWERTSEAGRQVVLTHELTHLALRHQQRRDLPLWLVEGAAEVTAYRPTGLPAARVAPSVTAAVAAGRPPSGPPVDAQLDPARTADLVAGYAAAWSWCDFLLRRSGPAGFTAFVRAAGRDPAGVTGRLSARWFGAPVGDLAPAYRAFLRSRR